MNLVTVKTLATLTGVIATLASASAEPLGTAFTVQGRVTISGGSLYGLYDLRFSLFDAFTGGNLVGGPLTYDGLGGNPGPVSLSNGQFTAKLDFGPVFDGRALWLHIEVRQHLVGTYLFSSPRQPLAVTPFALWALNGTVWSKNGDAIFYLGDVGIGTEDPRYNLHIQETDARIGVAAPASLGLHYTPENEPATDDWFFTAVGGTGNGFEDVQFIRKAGLDLRFATKTSPEAGPTDTQMILTGDGDLGVGAELPVAKVHIIGTTQSEAAGGGFLVLGHTLGPNLSMDPTQIMARFNGTPAGLLLNREGGSVTTGGDVVVGRNLDVLGTLDIGLEIVTSDACDPACHCVEVTCPEGKKLLGGGCESGEVGEEIESSHPIGDNGWHCRFDSSCPNLQRAYAICARVR